MRVRVCLYIIGNHRGTTYRSGWIFLPITPPPPGLRSSFGYSHSLYIPFSLLAYTYAPWVYECACACVRSYFNGISWFLCVAATRYITPPRWQRQRRLRPHPTPYAETEAEAHTTRENYVAGHAQNKSM